jgi:hypothetical protein
MNPESSTATALATVESFLADEPHFTLSAEDLRAAFLRQRLYPVVLASGSVYEAALQLYVRWKDLAALRFVAAEAPWVPVGRVGPMLVLGHCLPAQKPPLPVGWFQPVLLRKRDYARHLKLCAPLVADALAPDWNSGELIPPRRSFPGVDPKLVRPTTLRAALRFLLEYFPHQQADLHRVQEVLMNSDEIVPEELPPGYFGACWMLLERGGIADPTVISSPDDITRRLPATLASRVRVIGDHAKNLWVGMERLPQPDVEDILLNELGEGWSVHFLLLDGPRAVDRSPGSEPCGNGQADLDARGVGRQRVKIEDARTRSRAPDGTREPGVIRLSQKDIRDFNIRLPSYQRFPYIE